MSNESTWKFPKAEFIARHGDTLIKDFQEYFNTLFWKRQRVLYHDTKANAIWGELMKNSVIKFTDPRVRGVMEEIKAEVEAMVQVIHSLGDIIAQNVNVAVLGSQKLMEGEVSVCSVINQLQRRGIAAEVVNKFREFKDSKEFMYVSALSNTIKHRRLIEVEYSLKFTKGLESGLHFRSFLYGKTTYPKLQFNAIRTHYKNFLFDKTIEIGQEINNFLN